MIKTSAPILQVSVISHILSRTISITFDDGFKRSAIVSCPIFKKYVFLATFYIVTGWVEPARAAIRDVFNGRRAHGSWDFWRQVSTAGHEVGSHSFSHLNARGRFATLFPWLVAREISKSFNDLEREIPHVSYTMAMPWNAASRVSDFFVRRWFSGCRLGSLDVQYNDLSNLSRYGLKSWAPSKAHTWSDYVDAIDGLPNGGWLILQFHSFGDEGFDPVTPEFFDQLCQFIASRGLQVETVREVLSRCKTS